MNIIEAVKSGRMMRRPYFFIGLFLELRHISLRPEDILADDWEVEPEPEKTVTMTEIELMAAFGNQLTKIGPLQEAIIYRTVFERMVKELFKDK